MPTEAHLQSLASLQISSPALLKPHDPHPSGQQQQQQEYSEAREAPVAQAKPKGVLVSATSAPTMDLTMDRVPSRSQQLDRLAASSKEDPFDVLIIGGGSSGAGCAVDAQTRNLRTAMIEREDFASGTSSKSTKLVHGGVRYLEKAVLQLSLDQLKLVYEALHERDRLLSNAAHLARPLPILTPCYSWWEVIYYGVGLKFYDLLAGSSTLVPSKYMNILESLSRLPTMSKYSEDGRSLKGSILYYDGQFNDTRLNVTLATSAAAAGAAVSNYTDCVGLIKNEAGKVVGAHCRDRISGKEFDVHAKLVINAAGPFADDVRRASDPSKKPSVQGASGTHITLPDFYGSSKNGMIIPKTKDGRVVFMLPFQHHIIAGTTDTPIQITSRPRSTQAEIDFILNTLSDYLDVRVTPKDVLSAWCGIRPLPNSGKGGNTQNVVRDHVIFMDDDGMLNVTGGKWTTYRSMAEQAIDAALASGRLPNDVLPCQTRDLKLLGAKNYSYQMKANISQDYQVPYRNLPLGKPELRDPEVDVDTEIAAHLSACYGDNCDRVLSLAREQQLGKRLVPNHPVLEAEVIYTAQAEYCMTVEDFISRRSRLAFLDVRSCEAALPRISEILASVHGWSEDKRKAEVEAARDFLINNFTPGPMVHTDSSPPPTAKFPKVPDSSREQVAA
eukprot:CAMPEP_0202381224 /NCGR_PEP_ID=MMETSP1127-20130417/34157_1 /ASSEMBLY_ACC=CAM_ASM_000462 /TAXON_ID=3047 /ORGANISM="Dunaliella tertiolecta, Strain CCMP1320" /LENGTH=669 /DNA_ID=CAMNT_0048980117 /DNA_START=127 /DNA_END=2137 /DNA_ORIENTATION=-